VTAALACVAACHHFRMAPFEPPDIVLTGLKERVESLCVQGASSQSDVAAQLICDVGDRLYIGTANGNLSVYSVISTAGRYHCLPDGPRILNLE
jgi:hypothetical protein